MRMQKKTSRLGQMEMFGLALIVILVIIGFFIFVSFKSKQTTTDYKKDFIADEMASNFVNSIVNVNPEECEGYTISELLRYCARKENIQCGSMDACTAANNTISLIAERTLVKQGFSFNLYTEGLNWRQPGEEINITNLNCQNRQRGQSGVIPISLYPMPGHISLTLEICK